MKDVDDKTLLTLALIENLQRDDLTAIDEAAGYRAAGPRIQAYRRRRLLVWSDGIALPSRTCSVC